MRDSINTVESLIDYALELGHEVCAITEHDTIASHIRAEKYYKKIKEENPNFKVILGNEIYLVRNGLNSDNFDKDKDRYFHFILLAKDEINRFIKEINKFNINNGFVTIRCNYNNELLVIIDTNDKIDFDFNSLKKDFKIAGIVINNKTVLNDNFFYPIQNIHVINFQHLFLLLFYYYHL